MQGAGIIVLCSYVYDKSVVLPKFVVLRNGQSEAE